MIYIWKSDLRFVFKFPKSIRNKKIGREGDRPRSDYLETMVHCKYDHNGELTVSGLGGTGRVRWSGSAFLTKSVQRQLAEIAQKHLDILIKDLEGCPNIMLLGAGETRGVKG